MSINLDFLGWLIVLGAAILVFWFIRTLVVWYFGVEDLINLQKQSVELQKQSVENQKKLIQLLQRPAPQQDKAPPA